MQGKCLAKRTNSRVYVSRHQLTGQGKSDVGRDLRDDPALRPKLRLVVAVLAVLPHQVVRVWSVGLILSHQGHAHLPFAGKI